MYDESTDMEYVYVNGNRVDIRRAYAKSLKIFDDGTFFIPYEMGKTFYNVDQCRNWSVNVAEGVIVGSSPTDTYNAAAVFATANKIDLTNYSTLHVVLKNGTEYTADISNYRGEYYVTIGCSTSWVASAARGGFGYQILSAKQPNLNGYTQWIPQTSGAISVSVATIYLT